MKLRSINAAAAFAAAFYFVPMSAGADPLSDRSKYDECVTSQESGALVADKVCKEKLKPAEVLIPQDKVRFRIIGLTTIARLQIIDSGGYTISRIRFRVSSKPCANRGSENWGEASEAKVTNNFVDLVMRANEESLLATKNRLSVDFYGTPSAPPISGQ